MARCFRCERDAKEVRLNDALYETDLVKVCERCAITENIPVLRRPSTSQLKAAERNNGVLERLKRLSGIEEPENTNKSFFDEMKNLDENPDLEKPDKDRPFNLIRNFHWYIMRARRSKMMSIRSLARALGESETAIKMVEKGVLPEDSEKLIKKIEQFFHIRIREIDEEEMEMERKREREKAMLALGLGSLDVPIKPILGEEITGEELSDIDEGRPWTEGEIRPARILRFKPELMDNITIAELKKIKEDKEHEEYRESRKEEARQRETKDKVAQELKNAALGFKKETIEEKRSMLNRAIGGIGDKDITEKVPSIHELFDKKKDRDKAALEKEKMEARMLEKKSEQDQIKEYLKGEKRDLKNKGEKNPEARKEEIEISLDGTKNVGIQKLSDIYEEKGSSEGLLGEEIEVIEDEEII